MQAKKSNCGGYSSGSSRTAAVPKSEKPYFQFQNEGTGRFKETYKCSHDRTAGGGNKGLKHKKLSPNQKKI